MITRVFKSKRPRRSTLLVIAGTVLAAAAIWVIPGSATVLGDGPGPCDVQVADRTLDKTCTTEKGAIIEYIGDSSPDGNLGSSGTGVFVPFVRLQGSPSEQGYNTDGTTEFDTKVGTWTRAIKVSSIPVVVINGVHYWELFVDVNDSNSATHIGLNKVEIYYTSPPAPGGPTLTGYPFTGNATLQYSYAGQVRINDVNQGSGRGDLRYLVPLDGPSGTINIPSGCGYNPNPSSPCNTYFVLYSQWGAATAADTFASDGGFEEWKVRTLPSVSILKTANPAGPVNAGSPIGFDITVSNNSPVAATNVTVSDLLPAGGDLNWSLNPAFSGCSIAGAVGSQTLSCTFASLAGNASIGPIHITSPTTKADCALVSNTATVASGNDGGGSSTATVTVQCGALVIKKESTKGTNPLVKNAGAVFSVTGPTSFSVTDNGLTDEDSTIGQVCISGLAPGSYKVNETTPPSGYGAASQIDVPVTVSSGTDCGTHEPLATAAVFTNPPLGEIGVTFKDLGSGETKASIVCKKGTTTVGAVSENGLADPALDDTNETFTNLAPGTYDCQVVIDP